jgi:hypothetical protein
LQSTKFCRGEVQAKTTFSGHFKVAMRRLMAIGSRPLPKQIVQDQEKGGLVTKSPVISNSLALRS